MNRLAGTIRSTLRTIRIRRGSSDEVRRQAAHHNDRFFSELGVERATATEVWRRTSGQLGLSTPAAPSIHRLAFAALQVSGFRPRHILELGTSTGQTTLYLSGLFPEATVVTVELPDSDPIYRQWHPRGRGAAENLRRANIVPLRINTAFIGKENLPEFDLIWLDAGHFFPEVAWDHVYCLQKLAAGGWVFSDDVRFPDNATTRKRPETLDVWTVIEYFNTRQRDQFRFLLKREEPDSFVLDPKYIAYLQKKA